ncbi:hypothetical protein [Legionella septentrionalis]|uniref:hypothetical protein n=1 Tax=Legionella septentrionalis TaxID=2498109 RepID=UPI001F3BF030|nr:hypothetical protein [Legionella septentrionalis]
MNIGGYRTNSDNGNRGVIAQHDEQTIITMEQRSFKMANHPKLQIYQGIIQYLLDSTGYDLKNIAALSNATIKNIRTIYHGDEVPLNFSSSEKHLVQLYQMILDLNAKQRGSLKNLTKEIQNNNIYRSEQNG